MREFQKPKRHSVTELSINTTRFLILATCYNIITCMFLVPSISTHDIFYMACNTRMFRQRPTAFVDATTNNKIEGISKESAHDSDLHIYCNRSITKAITTQRITRFRPSFQWCRHPIGQYQVQSLTNPQQRVQQQTNPQQSQVLEL